MITLAAIGFFFKRAFFFVIDHWKVILPIVLVLVVVIFAYRSCKRTPTIDIERVERINKANETERKKELQAIIEDNQDVIRTVDNRSAITDVNVVEKNREIDARVKEADKAITEAKKQGRDITAQELECLLTGSCQ